VCSGFARTLFPGPGFQIYFWVSTVCLAVALFFPLALRFLIRFPDDRVPEARSHALWPWLFVAFGPFGALAFLGHQAVGMAGFYVTVVLGVSAMLAVVTRKYRGAGAVARRQMKWFVFGCYCITLPQATAALLTTLDPRLAWLWWASA
jgi:hypothetical protein